MDKKSYFRLLLVFVSSLLICSGNIFSQNNALQSSKKSVNLIPFSSSSLKWMDNPNDPKFNSFVENAGQLISEEVINKDDVKFTFEDNSMELFFTNHSVIYRIGKQEKVSEKEWEEYNEKHKIKSLEKENEKENKPKYITKTEIVEMKWVGASNDLKAVGEGAASFYSNFYMPQINKDKVIGNVKGYAKIVYRNVYPNIDIEYTIHPEEGIKYSYILHPGADVSSIRMKYSKEAKVKMDNDNNIIISTDIGDITDYAPLTYKEKENKGKAINSKFELIDKNTVAFKLQNSNANITETTIIDPWQVGPPFPANGYQPDDISVDGTGNVFIYTYKTGAVNATEKLYKYSPAGALIWTFNLTTNAAYNGYQGDVKVDPAGNSYLCNGLTAPSTYYNTIKVNPAGTALIWGTATGGQSTNNMYETWTIAFSCDYSIFYQSGGGEIVSPYTNASTYYNESVEEPVNAATGIEGTIVSSDSIGEIYDTYYSPAGLVYHMAADSNLNASTLPAQPATTGNNNTLTCVNPTTGARLWRVPSGYSYTDGDLKAPGSIGMNAMTSNSCEFLYTTDGATLDRWNIANGAHINQIAIPGGTSQVNQGGIYDITQAVNSGLISDACGNVYVGSDQHIYKYDPTLATLLNTYNVPGKVFDMVWSNLSNNTDILVCGGTTNATTFLADISVTQCVPPSNQITITATQPTCATLGSATAVPNFCSPSYSYLWSNGQTTATATNLSAGTYTVTVSSVISCPYSYVDTQTVVINAPTAGSAATTGPAQTVCGTTATLAGNTPASGSGTWTLSSGTGIITTPSSPTSTVTGLGTGLNVFEWTVSSPPCAPGSSLDSITVSNVPPVSNAGNPQSVCATIATLQGNVPASGTGTWSLISGTGIITNPNSPTSGITGLGAGSNVFQWTISSPPCPPSTSQVTITGGVTPTIANAGVNQNVCGTTATLAGNTAVSGIGTWTLVSGTGTITNSASPTSTVTGLGAGANIFQWTITDAPCPTTSSQITINVTIVNVSVTSATICAGQQATITANGATAYTWSAGATSLGGPNATASPATTTSYTVTGMTGACSATAVSTVTVNPSPTATVSGGGSVCGTTPAPNVTIQLTGIGPWSITYSDGTTSHTVNANTSPFIITNPAVGNYTVTAISDANCTGTFSGSAIVVISPLPVALFNAPAFGCAPFCTTFSDQSTVAAGAITGWNWNFGDGQTSTLQNPNHCYTSAGSYSVSLQVTTNSGCTASINNSNMIDVLPVPIAAFGCPKFESIDNPTIQFTDMSSGAISWLWNFGDSTLSLNNTSTLQNPQHTYEAAGTFCIMLTVSNGECIDTANNCLIIQPNYQFYIPNAFSPNGDGSNDFFFAKGDGISTCNMRIFDRWGNQIYYGNALANGWDGTSNGTIVKEDVYVYIIEMTDVLNAEHKFIGTVTVVK